MPPKQVEKPFKVPDRKLAIMMGINGMFPPFFFDLFTSWATMGQSSEGTQMDFWSSFDVDLNGSIAFQGIAWVCYRDNFGSPKKWQGVLMSHLLSFFFLVFRRIIALITKKQDLVVVVTAKYILWKSNWQIVWKQLWSSLNKTRFLLITYLHSHWRSTTWNRTRTELLFTALLLLFSNLDPHVSGQW